MLFIYDISAGDEIKVRCEYSTVNDDDWVFYGDGTHVSRTTA
mgnify:CR=1 FL=1